MGMDWHNPPSHSPDQLVSTVLPVGNQHLSPAQGYIEGLPVVSQPQARSTQERG